MWTPWLRNKSMYPRLNFLKLQVFKYHENFISWFNPKDMEFSTARLAKFTLKRNLLILIQHMIFLKSIDLLLNTVICMFACLYSQYSRTSNPCNVFIWLLIVLSCLLILYRKKQTSHVINSIVYLSGVSSLPLLHVWTVCKLCAK